MSELLSTVNQELNPETANLSDLPVLKILELLNEHDASVALSIRRVLPQVAEAVCVIAEQMRQGGRLFYVGAGTSGRLGVLDSAECPPTFGTEPELVQAIIAGGHAAMLSAVENIEDCRESAPAELRARQLNAQDVVLGIAASGRTPFVLSGLEYARQVGAKTIALSTRGWGLISELADVAIAPDVGAEVLSGSTRMKSGSAQKMLLGMISTAVMIQLGKVHGNLMIDVKASNEKLRVRAQRIVSEICDVKRDEAQALLNQVHYNVRAAVLLHWLDIEPSQALLIASKPFQSLKQQLLQGI
ncbi:N-acetylmuramic acid 6-phosphate etherase [Vibrio mimicus]|uniref:N-acetylmuramic acid 6-phosphate etherase n=1 Tax=Vibrio mimicus TaxID=674 RepID=UPI00076B32AB|nr:N-acetylmuramic acid 6-phosphate etherase [Vibrio mimicus]AMG01988.1 N-acetylmuramic acid 6-phosphate etherase [Vibrio mimicus]KAA3492006.1 N-acetylmuramic acid 6-phosphate etherase [Vibrio mimicus]